MQVRASKFRIVAHKMEKNTEHGLDAGFFDRWYIGASM